MSISLKDRLVAVFSKPANASVNTKIGFNLIWQPRKHIIPFFGSYSSPQVRTFLYSP